MPVSVQQTRWEVNLATMKVGLRLWAVKEGVRGEAAKQPKDEDEESKHILDER